MKKRDLTAGRFSFYTVVVVAGLLVLLYLSRVVLTLTGFAYYHQFSAVLAERPVADLTPQQHETAVTFLKKAIHFDSNNPDYLYELGHYLHEYSAESSSQERRDAREQGLQEAETWFKKAVLLDPGSPWYYYELARLSQRAGACSKKQLQHDLEGCVIAQYFFWALKNAPGNTFLRGIIIPWYYRRNEKIAVQLIKNILAGKRGEARITDLEIVDFLYALNMDYESDRIDAASTYGKDTMRGRDRCDNIAIIGRSTDRKVIELGDDDGSPEWRTYLVSDTDRVKKVICLPENIAEYDEAVLKIFMKGGGGKNFVTRISIDNHVIKWYRHDTPTTQAWHEIPFKNKILQGKSSIHVYIRTFGAKAAGDHLTIWGDQDAPSIHSTFHRDTTDDLSSRQGSQTGEYMIRLFLRKIGN